MRLYFFGFSKKLIQIHKKCDAIILNDVSNSEIGIKSDDNEVYFITKNGSKKINKNSKQIVAEKIVKKITEEFF